MRAVDVHIHRREAVGETFRDETLRGQVVTLVEIVLAQNVENAGITFETRWVECYAIEQVGDATETSVGRFEGDAADESVHFVAEAQQVVSEITPVLAGDTRNQRSFGHAWIVSGEISVSANGNPCSAVYVR
jgi:hypothetical protein